MRHEPNSHPIAGVVLAAGSSTRMGSNKLLLDLEGESLLRRMVSRAVAADLDPVIVVLGFEAERATREVEGLPCHVVVNTEYARGLTGSLQAGIRALPPAASAVLVMLADMPHVTTEMLNVLVRRYRATGARLVISDYQGIQAPPTLYDRSLVPELRAVQGSDGGKAVLRSHIGESEVVAWPAAAADDVDSPADYERVRSLPSPSSPRKEPRTH